jgi:hypothetical protein
MVECGASKGHCTAVFLILDCIGSGLDMWLCRCGESNILVDPDMGDMSFV